MKFLIILFLFLGFPSNGNAQLEWRPPLSPFLLLPPPIIKVKPQIDTIICQEVGGDSICAIISSDFKDFNVTGTLILCFSRKKFIKSYFATDTGSTEIIDFQYFEDSCFENWGQPVISRYSNEITYWWSYISRNFDNMEAVLTYKFYQKNLLLILKKQD